MKNKNKEKNGLGVAASKSRWKEFGAIKPVTKVIPDKKRKVKEREFIKSEMRELSFYFI